MSDSPLVARVKRSIRRAILYRLEAEDIRRDRQQQLSEKLGLHQPDVSRLLAGKLDRFSTDVLLRTAERLGAEFVYDPKADDEAVREYAKLLDCCRKTKSGAEVEIMNTLTKALGTMKSPIITSLKHKRELDALLVHLQKRPTPRQNLDWMTEQLESLIAEIR